jgi:hypothetical protein
MANYFYVRRAETTNQNTSTYTGVAIGEYFLLTAQSTATENGVYLRENSVNTKLADQPVIDVDLILSISQNQEWKRTDTNTFTLSATLSAAAGVRLAVLAYTEGVTKPVPTGYSNFPEQIDILKILDYSSSTGIATSLADYYTKLATYYSSPSVSNALDLNNAASQIKSYVLTEEDYNLLAGAVMNTQLYLKQYLPDILASYIGAIESFIGNQTEYYLQEPDGYAIYYNEDGNVNPPVKDLNPPKTYFWFKVVG